MLGASETLACYLPHPASHNLFTTYHALLTMYRIIPRLCEQRVGKLHLAFALCGVAVSFRGFESPQCDYLYAVATWSLLFSREERFTSGACAGEGGSGLRSAPFQNPLTPERRNYLLANAQVSVAAVGAGAFP